jgi:hypothetical protein
VGQELVTTLRRRTAGQDKAAGTFAQCLGDIGGCRRSDVLW